MFTKIISISLGAILINNFIFSQFLGCCPFLGCSNKVDTAVGMGLAVTFVMGLASAICWVVDQYILVPLGLAFLDKYLKWSSYAAEENSVMLAYASVYGHTENAANILAAKLVERGVKVRMYDTSVTPASYILSDAFRCSHLVFAATTYNAGIFVTMENLLHDIANHNLQNRKIAVLENGSWAPTSGKQMREILSTLKKCEFIGENVTIRSSLAEDQLAELDAIADAVAADIAAAKQ